MAFLFQTVDFVSANQNPWLPYWNSQHLFGSFLEEYQCQVQRLSDIFVI